MNPILRTIYREFQQGVIHPGATMHSRGDLERDMGTFRDAVDQLAREDQAPGDLDPRPGRLDIVKNDSEPGGWCPHRLTATLRYGSEGTKVHLKRQFCPQDVPYTASLVNYVQEEHWIVRDSQVVQLLTCTPTHGGDTEATMLIADRAQPERSGYYCWRSFQP